MSGQQTEINENTAVISLEDFEKLPAGSFFSADLRNDTSWSYGTIPGAVHLPLNRLPALLEGKNLNPGEEKIRELLESGKMPVLFCARGEQSRKAVTELRAKGIPACSLEGGYNAWLLRKMQQEKERDAGEKADEIEKGLTRKYRRKLFVPFVQAVSRYELIRPGDRIAVCISGGKDSFLMAKLFQELKRHNKIPFSLKFIVMDPGYSDMNRQVIENNAKLLRVPIEIHDSDIFDRVDHVDKNPCYLCARMRRGYLYRMAKDAGCNKIALGHHYDDVIETTLMGMLYAGQFQTMMPKLHATNFRGMELIRPMYLIREEDIKRWRDENGLSFIRCACHFTDTCSTFDPESHNNSKRMETKHLIAEMKKTNPYVEANIFRSAENVSLNAVLAWKKDGVKHQFTDTYDEKSE